MTDKQSIELPVEAQKQIKAIQSQMQALQNQLQQFVDGVLIGMGVDISGNINVNLDSMTVTRKEVEE